MATTKKAIYEKHGIMFSNGKIYSPVGPIAELLKEGNSKTGKAVYTFSLLPGTGNCKLSIDGKIEIVNGTCTCDCIGCYAKTGFYKMNSIIKSLAINTYLVNNHIEFVKNAIMAQLESIGRGEVRIHAAGDFNTADPQAYANLWYDIANDFTTFRFWTYTKIKRFETIFDGMKNANIVKSIIPNIGINYGKCEYIINAYYTLKSMGIKAYICKCGIDKNKHCENCGVCTAYNYVLFLEHSTNYNAEKDPLYEKLCEIVNNQ